MRTIKGYVSTGYVGSASILSGMKEYELKRLGGYIGNIYDALLTGDLPVPSKDGE